MSLARRWGNPEVLTHPYCCDGDEYGRFTMRDPERWVKCLNPQPMQHLPTDQDHAEHAARYGEFIASAARLVMANAMVRFNGKVK